MAPMALCIAQPITERHRKFEVRESNVKWAADIDTTLEYTAIHAERIAVSNGGPSMEANIGNPMTFKLLNKDGEGRTVNGRVNGLATINGKTYYTALLELGLYFDAELIWKKVPVVLMDRTNEEYRLVVGRNFTQGTVQVKN